MRRAPLVLLGACALLAPGAALAQSAQDKAEAEALFNAGKAALAAGNLAEACPKLAESQNKDPAIGTALYLAECYERSGKIASAWAEFHQAEDMANQRHDPRASIAKSRADRLTPSRLTIVLAPGANDVAGLEVKRDGEVVGSALFGLATPIDGGHHVIVATAPGRGSFDWQGDVPDQRGAVTVTIPKLGESAPQPVASTTAPAPKPAAPPPVPTPEPPPAAEHRGGLGGGKIAGLVIGGVGLAAIGVSITLAAIAKGNYNDAVAANGCNGDTGSCPNQTGVDALSGPKTLADVATGVFIGGCVAAAGGIVLFFVAPKPNARASALTVTPMFGAQGAGALLSGRF